MDEDVIHTQTHTRTQEYYSAVKKNRLLPCATMHMDLEDIMLSEISQRMTNAAYHLYVKSRKHKRMYMQGRKRLTGEISRQFAKGEREGQGHARGRRGGDTNCRVQTRQELRAYCAAQGT